MTGSPKDMPVRRTAMWLCALSTALACARSPEPLGDRLAEVRQLFENACSHCHSLEIPLSRKKSWDGWQETVRRMRQKGAPLDPAEAADVARYLALVRGR